MPKMSAVVFRTIVERLSVAVFVFERNRLTYTNPAAARLASRLRGSYRIEIEVILRAHLASAVEQGTGPPTSSGVGATAAPAVTLLTASHGEPFYVHVIPVGRRGDVVAVTVRWLGTEIEAFRLRHGLSRREAQVAELVLHGYRNADIASTLGIAPATTKKHLTRIFDKVGVDSRSQLIARLA
jgi:DNA-binding CsgD family transcriptional regulator